MEGLKILKKIWKKNLKIFEKKLWKFLKKKIFQIFF